MKEPGILKGWIWTVTSEGTDAIENNAGDYVLIGEPFNRDVRNVLRAAPELLDACIIALYHLEGYADEYDAGDDAIAFLRRVLLRVGINPPPARYEDGREDNPLDFINQPI